MDEKTNRVLAEINAKLPLAELESRLKARGYQQDVIDDVLGEVIEWRKVRAEEIAREHDGLLPWRRPS